MAEGWARHLIGDQFDTHSAGVDPHGVNPRAVHVMAEAGIDISAHRSQHLDDFRNTRLDWIVTVCDHAHEVCPVVSGSTRVVHHSFDDPPRLAVGAVSEEETLAPYRRVRDEIREFIESLPARLEQLENQSS